MGYSGNCNFSVYREREILSGVEFVFMYKHSVLSTRDFIAAEKASIACGAVSESKLIRNLAGNSIADFVSIRCQELQKSRILIICGPGNNGGDGMVASYTLRTFESLRVDVWFCANAENLSPTARLAYESLNSNFLQYDSSYLSSLNDYDLIVDAIFGTGLNCELDKSMVELINSINSYFTGEVISIDIPSGFDGNALLSMGAVIHADFTVTWVLPKLFHVLYPGNFYSGELAIKELPIDISNYMSDDIIINSPDLWHNK